MSYLNSVTTAMQQPARLMPEIRPKSKAMNVALWILQILWGVFFCFTGFGKVMCYRPDVWNYTLHQPVPWFHAVPQGLFVFIGVAEFLGGAGLILPAMTGIKPKLIALAAAGLALIMILAVIFHIVRGEFSFFVPMNLVLGAGAAFITYARVVAAPNKTRPISPLSIMAGLVVLAALVFVGFAPIWYQVTQTH